MIIEINGSEVYPMDLFDMQSSYIGALERLLTPRARKGLLIRV